MEKIKLFLVDDHSLFRRGLKNLLNEMGDFEVVGEVSNPLEAFNLLGKLEVDIILLDVNMPEMNGVQAIQQLRKLNPAIKILMLTISQDNQDLIGAINNGANGYVLKNTEPEILKNSILQVYNGNSVLSPEITTEILNTIRRTQQDKTKNILTEREIDVLRCLAKGNTTSNISNILFISENTVKTHIRHIMEKMEVKNRAEAVAKGAQLGFF
jgi:two-component system nitrate/nitrite response regulator NarL